MGSVMTRCSRLTEDGEAFGAPEALRTRPQSQDAAIMFHPHSSEEELQPGEKPAPLSRDRLRLPGREHILTLTVPLDATPEQAARGAVEDDAGARRGPRLNRHSAQRRWFLGSLPPRWRKGGDGGVRTEGRRGALLGAAPTCSLGSIAAATPPPNPPPSRRRATTRDRPR